MNRALTALLVVVMSLAVCFAVPARIALAEDGDGSADTADTSTADTSTSETTDAATKPTITIDSATAVVTASSGYHLKATIANPTADTLPAGTLTLTVNARFTFFSRTDIQQWAEGTTPIPAMDVLGTADVAELAPGASTSVTVDVDQDDLKQIVSWGPKPLALTYAVDGQIERVTHSFLTRSTDGLNIASTPAMNMTIVLPISSTAWQADETAVTKLVNGQPSGPANGGNNAGGNGTSSSGESSGNTSDSVSGSSSGGASTGSSNATSGSASGTPSNASADAGQVVTLGDDAQLERTRLQAVSKHPALQVIADPTTLNALSMPPQVSGIMQPAGFDISSYSAYGDADAYREAGVESSAWNADAALADYRSAIGDQNATRDTYAWQGKAVWSLQSLAEAKRQGYSTVIADHEFDASDDSTVHTGKIVVPTDAGEVTVLTEQRELSRLAQGKATSDTADSETSAAGRLARFVAQSAFYQMEQPYTSRNLLVCFGTGTDAAMIDALMSAVEQSPWLNLTDLNTLSDADAYASGDDALQLVQDSVALTDTQSQQFQQTLASLTASRSNVSQFVSSVLDPDSDDAKNWATTLLDAQSTFALHALSGHTATAEHMATGAVSLSTQLLNGVSIAPSESVTVVSETAKMMVTISNQHPYPVHVKVSSLTDSPEIVTSRIAETNVPAHGESQVTFTIRVATSGKATATISLQDRDGHPFGAAQSTSITSVLRISDMSGFVIIGFAIVLGLLGLWRQFNRKKDPDE
ncbi:DUF6049 family protein [Bifidobacterium simiiventris]|uniref:DUF6049 family protein n=1 Tax=Bifidobacterium simiiventris TaxID=2834434 RepID=UPI001C5601AF|nr:DUF6049 family protein [Bifidobacterium simiiventris]